MASRQDVRRFLRRNAVVAAGAAPGTAPDPAQALRAVAEADGPSRAVDAASALLDGLGFGGFALGSIGLEDDTLRATCAAGAGPMAQAVEACASGTPVAQGCVLRGFLESWRVTDLTPQFSAPRPAQPIARLLALGVRAAALLPLTAAGPARVAAAVAGGAADDAATFSRRLSDNGWLARLGLLALADRLCELPRREAPGLSTAERAVLRELARGLRPCEIATALGKSERTVRAQIDSARARLVARTPAAAVAGAIRAGLILP